MNIRYLTVPKNQPGMNEYDYGIEHTSNMIERVLGEEEFEALYNKYIFKRINDECGLMIDDYESEEISSDNLRKCIHFISEIPGVFYEMAKIALKYDTVLYLDF